MSAPRSPHYSFERLSDGLHAAIATRRGAGVCNSGVLDLGGSGLVFDTGLTPVAARDLRAAATALLGRPPALAALSHRHLDHILGNQEFSGIPIWATRRTREVILERLDEVRAELTREALEKDIRELEELRAKATSEEARTDLDMTIQMNRVILECARDLRIVPPDHTFESRLALPGTREAELISFGSGHTESDAVLFLPQDGILYAGDVVVARTQPSMGSGDPDHWQLVLDEIERLRVERIVPGHGPLSGREAIQETRAYLAGVLEAAEGRPGAPLPPSIRRWEGSSSLEGNLRFARGWVAAHRPRA